MSQKTIKIAGWVLTIILALLFGFSALLKITQQESALAQAVTLGISPAIYQVIGVIELVSLVFFIVPRTGLLGALLLIAYMGGAIATHMQHQQPIAMAVTIQVLIWIALVLRFPEIRQRLFQQHIKSI